MTKTHEILADVNQYFVARIREHGPTPRGVDWRDRQAQELRFRQLLKVCDLGKPFSIHDFGCGYGSFYEFLRLQKVSFDYIGSDLCDEMLEAARSCFPGVKFLKASREMPPADYCVASGIFNLKGKYEDSVWTDYVMSVIDELNRLGNEGFAFNMLTLYSDPSRCESRLYYADPSRFFDLCKRKFSRNVALLHDYDLYDFTILVRKA